MLFILAGNSTVHHRFFKQALDVTDHNITRFLVDWLVSAITSYYVCVIIRSARFSVELRDKPYNRILDKNSFTKSADKNWSE